MTESTTPDVRNDRHRLTRRALILFLPLFLLLTIINSGLLLSGALQEHKQIEQSILNSLRLLKDASVVIENSFVAELNDGLQLFLDQYKSYDGKIELIDLEALQQRLGNTVDLYAIDVNGVVRHSTMAQDIGLDFRQWPDFHAYLEDIRQSGELRIDAISKETKTGLFRKYAYLPTPDQRWILELGVKSDIIAQRLAPFDPVVVANRLVTDHPHLNRLRIIDRHGWQLSMTQPTQVEPEVFERVRQVLDTGVPKDILDWNRKLTYLPLPDGADEVSFGLRMQVVELDCNLDRIKFGLGVNLLIAVAAIALMFRLSRGMKQMEEGLRESEERFKALHNASFGGIAIHDEGIILDCNQGLSKISGFGYEDLIGMDSLLLIAEQSRETVMRTICSGDENPYEVFGVRKNGTEYPLRLEAKNIPYQGKRVRVVEFRDITESRRTQLALQQKTQEMEQFVYSVSHDLKSPLVTVKTFVGMLRQDIESGNRQRIHDDLNYIDRSTVKMQQLLDALLKFSRVGNIDAPTQTLSVDQLIHNCLATLAGILQQHRIQVATGELSQLLQGDPLHFGQIWQNLIENAVKYRGDQSQPCIEIGATNEGGAVVFYVRDNGMGIEPEHKQKIFDLFSQLNPNSDGSGLGLALVKKIVSIYQGRIWVESEGKDQGSCFKFTLPGALIRKNEVV